MSGEMNRPDADLTHTGTGPPPSINGWNGRYVEELYQQWLEDPGSTSGEWTRFFEGFDLGSLTNGSFDAVSQAPQWGANWQNWWTRIRQVGHTLQSNVPLLDNVLDWSIQNEGLMEVRAKNIQFRPLAQLDEDQQGWVTATGVVAAPILFLLFGLMRLGSRRRRRQRLSGTTS